MYSLEQKQLAVQTYNELYSYRKTIQVLGYPGSRNTLKLWVHEYSKNGSIEEKTYTRKRSKLRNKSPLWYSTNDMIERMNNTGLTRSMSEKGCSPDNAACEAFFGRLKNEMFYNHSW